MAKTIVTTVAQTLSGDGFGSSSPLYNSQQTNTAGVVPGSATLAVGNNTITVPAAALGVVIVRDASALTPITLKGIAGDTGIACAPGQPISLPFVAGAVASFIINASAIETIGLLWQ